jgi:neurotransmitter:Na+ symporter, NSS family
VKHQREHWASRLGLLMAAIGSAVGLGSLWKFPYVVGDNGGGLFVLFYLLFVIFLGIPVFIAELLLGRRAQRGVVGIFAALAPSRPNWRMAGWIGVASPILILSYYTVVSGWGLNYVLLSLDQFWANRNADEIKSVFDVLYTSGSINLLFQIIFILIATGMVYQGVRKGIEFWSRVMTFGLLVIMLVLFFYACTLRGFGQAAHFVFTFDASRFRPSSIIEALGLALFTLSLGQGIMMTYGSYMSPQEDIPKVSVIVGFSVVVVALLSSMVVFPIIFTFDVPMQKQAGLVFETLPVLFSQMPGALIISTIYFIMFAFTALTTVISMLEVVVANFIDLYNWPRHRAAWVTGAITLVVGIPSALAGSGELFPSWQTMYNHTFFQTMDILTSSWMLPLLALLIAIFAGWVVQRDAVREEFRRGTRWTLIYPLWRFFMRWVVPVAIFLVMLQQGGVIDVDRWVHR